MRQRTRGAALLTAMLTVTLVATLASAALWQQWRSVEVEAAERSRIQMQWVLHGALDWARLILQEDARDGAIDHLSEPWALPLQEARLSSFLALDKNNTNDAMDAFLSGQISDQQALLNVRNLVQNGKVHAPTQQAFGRLFERLNLPRAQLQLLADGLLASDRANAPPPAAQSGGKDGSEAASDAGAQPGAAGNAAPARQEPMDAPLKPQRMEQLVWLGLSAATVQALQPYATLLPQATPLNLNTASAQVLQAALPDMDLPRAQQMVNARALSYYKTPEEALRDAGMRQETAAQVDTASYAVGSRYFAVRGRLRLGDSTVQEVSLVERNGTAVRVVWRQREVLPVLPMASLQ